MILCPDFSVPNFLENKLMGATKRCGLDHVTHLGSST